MEWAANVLCDHFQHVVVWTNYVSGRQPRFRADNVKASVYFCKTVSQRDAWRKNGGAFISWDHRVEVGPHDAALFACCPLSLDRLDKTSQQTLVLAVVYIPPTWRLHEDVLARRYEERPYMRRAGQDRLLRLRAVVETAPHFSRQALARLRARPVTSQSSFSPGSPAGAAHFADRTR